MFTDIYMPPCIWVDEIQFAAWCIGAELQTDLTFWELINWLVGWILHKESGARWTVPRFKFYMCTGVVNVSSTAWLGMAFMVRFQCIFFFFFFLQFSLAIFEPSSNSLSMLSERTTKFESNVSKTIEILFTWMLNLNTNSHVHIL